MYCTCGRISENRETGECASCGLNRRKAERMTLKVKTPIKKVSDKQRDNLNQYATIRAQFLLGRWCAVHGKPCMPTEVHHQIGRTGFADDKEIPLLIDVRYFIAVCHDAHVQITNNTPWAI